MRVRRVFSVLAGALAFTVVASAAPAYAEQTVFDTGTLAVRYQGRTVTRAELARLNADGQALHVAYDVVSARAGRAHAFDSEAEVTAWAAVRERPRRAARPLFSIRSAAAVCYEPTSGSRLYDSADCGGNYLAVLRNKDMPYLSSFGAGGSSTWNDRASSIVEEGTTDCALLVRLYQHSNYNTGSTGWVKYYYGDSVPLYWNMESGVSNESSSLHSTCA